MYNNIMDNIMFEEINSNNYLVHVGDKIKLHLTKDELTDIMEVLAGLLNYELREKW